VRLRWVIKTADALYSGTDSDVYLALSGTLRTMPEVRIDNPNSSDNFEKGDIDTGILVVEDDLGPLTSGQLRVDSSGDEHPWRVDWVQILPEGVPTDGPGGWRAEVNTSADENGMFPMLRFSPMGGGEARSFQPGDGPGDSDEAQVARELDEVERKLRFNRMRQDLALKKQQLAELEEKLSPPIGPAFRTYELFGWMDGKVVPLNDIITKTDKGLDVVDGGRLMIGQEPEDGFGLAGNTGKWFQYVDVGPGVFGLEPDGGVLTSDGKRVLVCDAEFLMTAFGEKWRDVVYSK